jgi:hypothetical protein
MMAPDYAHWHGMYEVAERFYMKLVPQARELARHAAENGQQAAADNVRKVIDEILARPEHQWFERELKGREAIPVNAERRDTKSVEQRIRAGGGRA